MTTPAIVYVNSKILELIQGVVVTNLCEWLRTVKNVQVSCEEVLTALQLPLAVPLSPLNAGAKPGIPTSMPGYLVGAPVTQPALAAAPAKRGSKAPYTGPTCQYTISRGNRQGELCGKAVEEGLNYCKACKIKRGAGGPGTNAARSAGKGPLPVPTQTGAYPTVPLPNQQVPHPGVAAPPPTNSTELTPIPGTGKYFDPQNHFQVNLINANTAVVEGIIEPNGEVRALTDAEKSIAVSAGYSLPPESSQPAPQNSLPPQAAPQLGAQVTVQPPAAAATITLPFNNIPPPSVTVNLPFSNIPPLPVVPSGTPTQPLPVFQAPPGVRALPPPAAPIIKPLPTPGAPQLNDAFGRLATNPL